MGRTPVKALNCSVSSESLAVPEGQPWMERRARMICSGLIEIGSGATPTITSLPRAAELLDGFGRSARAGVDVFVRAQFSGQGLLVPATSNGHGPEAHPAGALNPE